MKFSHNIEQSPRDLETTMRQNLFLTVFQTQKLFHYVRKTVRTTLQCIVGLQSRGEGHEIKKNVGQICPVFFLAFQTVGSGALGVTR